MPNLNAALGCAQLEQLDSYLKFKRELFHKYQKVINEYTEVRLLEEQKFAQSNYWLQTIIFEKEVNIKEVLQTFDESGFQCRPVWKPLHLLNYFSKSPRKTNVIAEKMQN